MGHCGQVLGLLTSLSCKLLSHKGFVLYFPCVAATRDATPVGTRAEDVSAPCPT